MPAQLNHTIVWCHDKHGSSAFLSEILGLPEPTPFMHFMVIALDNGVSLDYMEKSGDIALQHYAFLISETEFDSAFARIKEKGLNYWADPAKARRGEINRHDGGRGCYFDDPNGHLLEILTRPYGSGDASQ
jgi:catechol 2,3-dioxygenase-like lactoylglutathione lyase family enzyme